MESPESWFEDFGTGHIKEGYGNVELDPDFAALVQQDDFHIFLTPYGDSNGLYVVDVQPDGFAVREQLNGTHSVSFAYRVVARRRDVTVTRLEPVRGPAEPARPGKPPRRQAELES